MLRRLFFWGTIEDLFLSFLTIFALEFCGNVHLFITLWNRRSSIPILLQTYFTITHKKPRKCKIVTGFLLIIGCTSSCKTPPSSYSQKVSCCKMSNFFRSSVSALPWSPPACVWLWIHILQGMGNSAECRSVSPRTTDVYDVNHKCALWVVVVHTQTLAIRPRLQHNQL